MEKSINNIVYIGDFDRSFSTENYVAYALEKNSVRVVKLADNQILDVVKTAQDIITEKPDFVLFCKARVRNAKKLIDLLRAGGIKTVTWLFDLYFDLPPEMEATRSPSDPPFYTDIVFTTDGGHNEQFSALGINHKVLRQGIHEPQAMLGKRIHKIPQIMFIGNNRSNLRRELIANLNMWYPKDFVHHGWGGEDEIRGEVLNNYLASAKIIVGDSVPTPYYWSNRIYEILGRGGFLIHPKVEGLDKEFKPYKHYVPYERGNWSQLKEIIDYYLVHDEERKKIQMAGFRYCKKHYTYTKRVAELLKQI